MALKLGKKPAREGAYRFKLSAYLTAPLPAAPAVFGHQALEHNWMMLGNDRYGDCVFAGAAHETMLWNLEASKVTPWNDAAALSDYSAVTGFNPNDPNSDQGTDMAAAASYRRKTGVIDAAGTRHKVDAYLELPGVSAKGANQPALLDALASAAYIFGAVGVGIEFPASAMAQFNAGKPWDYIAGSPIDGGHYIPLVGRAVNGNYLVVTWGKVQEVTPTFLLAYVDEAIAYVSLETLTNGKTLEGFDAAGLRDDLAQLDGQQPAPTPTPTPSNIDVILWNAVKGWTLGKHYTAATKAVAAALKAWAVGHGLT